jgi:1-deoxy-D-xylulose-5-phosphate reductoisomerase
MSARSITVLGVTGSIGASTLDLIEREPDAYRVEALTAHRDVARLAEAARRTRARTAVIGDESSYDALKQALAGSGIEAAAGPAAICDAARSGADWTMAAIVGSAGLAPVLAALEGGRTLALANKEALVCAGDIVNQAVRRSGARMLPVDSEHNAVFQCFDHEAPERVRKVVLTASGGPFRLSSIDEMRRATPAQAVQHPTWSMGAKISVDSATLMNKGLELIEAFHLFPLRPDQLEVIVHPQSVVHSMVDYVDGSVLAQMGSPDMRVPIAYALAWPARMATPVARLDLAAIGRLDFEAPDEQRFPALRLAREALVAAGARPAVLNAANEAAVAAFLSGRIGFLDISAVVEQVLNRYDPPAPTDLEGVTAVDVEARRFAEAEMMVRA